jgi:hypothetical protein
MQRKKKESVANERVKVSTKPLLMIQTILFFEHLELVSETFLSSFLLMFH